MDVAFVRLGVLKFRLRQRNVNILRDARIPHRWNVDFRIYDQNGVKNIAVNFEWSHFLFYMIFTTLMACRVEQFENPIYYIYC